MPCVRTVAALSCRAKAGTRAFVGKATVIATLPARKINRAAARRLTADAGHPGRATAVQRRSPGRWTPAPANDNTNGRDHDRLAPGFATRAAPDIRTDPSAIAGLPAAGPAHAVARYSLPGARERAAMGRMPIIHDIG